MPDPTTTNIGLIVPNTGADVGTWGDVAINPDMVSIDGFFGGVVSISLGSSPVTLTAPAAAITAAAGPNQSSNRVLRFTGALTANVQVTLPLPGAYIVENNTTGAFVVTFKAPGAGEIVATPQGSRMQLYSDATNVRFCNGIDAIPGKLMFMGGIIALPAWINACTVKPFLLCDASLYNVATYPALAALYGSTFGGNGSTTFGVPDLGGRVPLAYDWAGNRINVPQTGINGQTLGSFADNQAVTLQASQIPAHTHPILDPGHTHSIQTSVKQNASGFGGSAIATSSEAANNTYVTSTEAHATGIVVQDNTGGGDFHSNVQPSIVSGIWLVKT